MSIQVIVQPPATLVLQQDVTSANVTQETTRTLEIVTAGPQGPRGNDGNPGANGANGEGLLPALSFGFGDASSVVMVTSADGPVEITRVALEIEEEFDGVGASLRLGTLAQPDLLMAAAFNSPYMQATFEVSPGVELPASSEIYFSINAGSATQGSGKIVISIAPTN